jgi:radical SAM superfamily enzyme YgiQ (UPF0313 family)
MGEAESVLEHLLNSLRTCTRSQIPGIAWQSDASSPAHTEGAAQVNFAPLIRIDDVCLPDYSLYPQAADDPMISLEVGRGCPYACTFCSTNTFFSRFFRMRTTALIVRDIEKLMETRGIKYFDFNHDMFTTNERLVREICGAIISRNLEIKWGCSARTDRVSQELLLLMREAGMTSIFFGIESGSPSVQSIIKKRLDVRDAEGKIRFAQSIGTKVAASFIIGFPEEGEDDLDQNHIYVSARSVWRPADMVIPSPSTLAAFRHGTDKRTRKRALLGLLHWRHHFRNEPYRVGEEPDPGTSRIIFKFLLHAQSYDPASRILSEKYPAIAQSWRRN